MYAEVLIEYSAKSVDRTFTYVIPSKLKEVLVPGMKVKVPFNNRLINGFVTKIKDDNETNYELKEISDIIDANFKLNEELMELGEYLQSVTLCTKITAYQTMLPSSLKVKEQKVKDYSKYLFYIELDNVDKAKEYVDKFPRRKKKIEVINSLLENNKVLKNQYASSIVKELIDEGIIKVSKEQIYRLQTDKKVKENVILSEDQVNAVDSISLNKFDTYLLHGVTGSGKTEVYMHLIEKVIDMGKTAIMLVPEISLTTQIINNFYKRFGNQVAIFHSNLSEGERYDEYLKIYRGEVKIVVGTRSAIFTPLKDIGLIIIDEEHSDTYKQDSNPRYHAIDMAKFRAEYNKCPLILGSATPTLETMARAIKGVYKYISMPNRIGHAVLPKITIVDMAEELKHRSMTFSRILIE